jgi:hypothetical protein
MQRPALPTARACTRTHRELLLNQRNQSKHKQKLNKLRGRLGVGRVGGVLHGGVCSGCTGVKPRLALPASQPSWALTASPCLSTKLGSHCLSLPLNQAGLPAHEAVDDARLALVGSPPSSPPGCVRRYIIYGFYTRWGVLRLHGSQAPAGSQPGCAQPERLRLRRGRRTVAAEL